METLLILSLFVISSATFTFFLLQMKKRIETLETCLDIQVAYTKTMNDIFQKSITIIKDALIDYDNRINLNKNIIMSSVDSNKFDADIRFKNLETAEKNNNTILQQEIRMTRSIVDNHSEDIENIKDNLNEYMFLKNKIESYLNLMEQFLHFKRK